MKKSTLAAVLGNIVSLIALWLVNFGVDLSPEDQATIVSALLLIVNTCALAIPAVLAGMKRAPPSNPESGQARTSVMLALGAVTALMVMLMLPGCQLPETPRQAIAASYVTVESLAETAEVAHRDGVIDDQQRSIIHADLQTAMNALRDARQIEAAGGDPTDRLSYARSVLTAIQSLLPREVPANE